MKRTPFAEHESERSSLRHRAAMEPVDLSWYGKLSGVRTGFAPIRLSPTRVHPQRARPCG